MKRIGGWILFPVVAAMILCYRLGLIEFVTAGRLLALLPGGVGRWMRRAWYRRTLVRCGEALEVDWMASFRSPRASVGHRVFIGPFSWIGRADLGDDVMLGGHVTILSGARHHDPDLLDRPMRESESPLENVRIGADAWLGNGAIVMADVADHSVVAAGAVVTRTYDPGMILAGVPARPLRRRGERS